MDKSRFQEFIFENGRKVLYLLLGLILAFLLMYRLSRGNEQEAIIDYLNAEVLFQKFQESTYLKPFQSMDLFRTSENFRATSRIASKIRWLAGSSIDC